MGLPGDLVRAAGVDVFEGYAATDARQFSGNINPSERKEVEARYQAWIDGKKRAPQPWLPPHRVDAWNVAGLKRGYEELAAAKAGACTDFGVGAAYLLGKAAIDNPKLAKVRIEVVSWSEGTTGIAHTYVLVGRTADYADGHMLPEPRNWAGQSGEAWYLVDGWAGSLGHDVTYRKASGFPFRGMTKPLRLVLTNSLTD